MASPSIGHRQKSCEAFAWYNAQGVLRGAAGSAGCLSAGAAVSNLLPATFRCLDLLCPTVRPRESSPECSLRNLSRPCSRYTDFTWALLGEGQEKHHNSWASKVRLGSGSTDHRPRSDLFPSRNHFREVGAHSDEIGFAPHISLAFGRRAAQELFRGSLGIGKKKILYIRCASLIFPLIPEASCKLHS